MADAAVGSGMTAAPRGGRGLILGAGALGLAGVVLVGWYFLEVRRAGQAAANELAPVVLPEAERQARRAAAEQFLDGKVKLTFDQRTIEASWRELALVVDEAALDQDAQKPVMLDRGRALEILFAYKDRYDRPASDARMDLENRKVLPETEGYGIQVYESLVAIEEAALAGRGEVALGGAVVTPSLTRAKLGNVDISHVMGWFETHYPPIEKDRNYNLKVAAERINGTILLPGETFSFNDKVGDRTEKEGYRVAHVITAGELVDGLAGGTCQVSSTLHGAAWFAGLDIPFSRPHSRPSAYIPMALDATVVYPKTDLKLKNPYDFPVVLRYVVSQGTMRVEVLGQERPWDKIAFEREIKKEIPYETITREDDTMPVGSSVIEQVGFPGYELVRKRIYYKSGKEVKTEKATVKYPPTTEYIRVGTNIDPNLTPPKQPGIHGPMNPGGVTWRMVR